MIAIIGLLVKDYFHTLYRKSILGHNFQVGLIMHSDVAIDSPLVQNCTIDDLQFRCIVSKSSLLQASRLYIDLHFKLFEFRKYLQAGKFGKIRPQKFFDSIESAFQKQRPNNQN